MNALQDSPARLNIPTRDMVFAFILAALVAAVIGALINSLYQDLDRIALPVAHAVAAVVFVLLVMLGGKQSLPAIIAATSIKQEPGPGPLLLWVAIAMLAGLIFRFGISGLAYGMEQLFHLLQSSPQSTALHGAPADPEVRIDALLLFAVLLGASVEEFSYRRVLQSYFCRKYGLWTGIFGVSTAFGAIHASPAVIVAGFCLALLYLYSGRLWVAIIAHATANLVVHAMDLVPLSEAALLACCGVSAVTLVAAMAIAIQAIKRSPRVYN